jgi:hypothetical protein
LNYGSRDISETVMGGFYVDLPYWKVKSWGGLLQQSQSHQSRLC